MFPIGHLEMTNRVLSFTGTFEEEPPSVSEMLRRYEDVCSKKLPFLVAYEPSQSNGEIEDKILGYAYVNYHHTRSAWRFTVEDSIYIDASHARKGVK
jgi:L-amino acid N-acyltransferase YncA